MTSPAGLLQYFVLEASDYIEGLDAALATAGASGPDTTELGKLARMLRGTATMSRQGTLAELAGGVERMARALRDGAIRWEPATTAVFIAAVDDLKLLIRQVRDWGEAQETRARARIDEMARLAPPSARTSPTPPAALGSGAYLAFEAGEIATALQSLVAQPLDRAVLGNVLSRARALRGVAALRDLPPLGDVVDGIERAAKPLELGAAQATAPQLSLFAAAAALLRQAADQMRRGGRPDPAAQEVQRFSDAASALASVSPDADAIVPISELYFADAGPHVVSAAPHPPTTPAERFRLEVVSQAEHLRRLVADARQARDAASRERLGRELRSALQALGRAAESFGEREVAAFVSRSAETAGMLDASALGSIDEVASILARPSGDAGDLARRLATVGAAPTAQPMPAARQAATALPPPPTPAPRQAAAPTAARYPTPTGRALHDLLEVGIAGIDLLAGRPLSQPVDVVDDTVVPIETLLYRGRAALDRARAVRDELRSGQGTPDPDALAELYDLLDLAVAD